MNERGLFTAVFLLSSALAAAQPIGTTAGAIDGIVTDATAALLPGVTVTLAGPAVMGVRSTVTDQAGFYRFQQLPPGEYTLTFELAGFTTVRREGIRVALGFTATINVEMTPAALAETVTVSGISPVVDLRATTVTTSFTSERLASLPGARDVWAVLAQTPAVAMGRVDVGGSGALTQQPYTAYGLASAGGVNRSEIEGVMVNEGAGGGGSDMGIYTDYGAFAEIAINAVGNSAAMPAPGVLSQLIAKSGGNSYRGNLYVDYSGESMVGHNIDERQVSLGVTGSPYLAARDLNRLERFRDFNADLGGYLRKDLAWWYAAYRRTVTGQRYPTLIDDVQMTWVPVYTGKLTLNVSHAHRLVAFFQHADKDQPDYLGSIVISPTGRTTPALQRKDTVWHSHFPTNVWKVEYGATLGNAVLFEVRAGEYHSVWWRTGKSEAPRVEDVGNNAVSGGTHSLNFIRNRPQVNGSLSYYRTGWGGSHTVKLGGEIMRDSLRVPFYGFPDPRNAVSIFNNGIPTQVRVFLSPGVSENGLWTSSVYLTDTWQVARRASITLGLRYDRQRPYLPAQTAPTGEPFAGVDRVLVWQNWGPRLSGTYDLGGRGITVIKVHYGQYWLYPGSDFATDVNPNPPLWSRTYTWSDRNGNGVWDAGEEGRLVSAVGGRAATTLDPDLKNTFVRQVTAYLERELRANFGVRSGIVWNGRHQVRGQINVNRPLAAYTEPVPIRDPGPDGRLGTFDDGPVLTAYNLAAAALTLPVINITTNLPREADSDYYTWELTATKREADHWSLLASLAYTWSRESNLTGGSGFSPNAFINTDNGRRKFTTWQWKVNGTVRLPGDVRLTPVYRHQSGRPFARTFVQTFNWGNATILAEPFGTRRTRHINVVDVRTEKIVRLRAVRLIGFVDLYNLFNANAEQEVAVGSGGSFLRPTAITPPRTARLGLRLDW